MKKLIIPTFATISLIALVLATAIINNNNVQTTRYSNAQQAAPVITPLAKNLEVPWALGFLPDGNILFTERTGKVKLLNRTANQVTTITTIPNVKAQAESGLLGLAVHPQFNANNYVYIYHSYNSSGGTQNRVIRYTFSNNQLTNPLTIIDAIPGNDYHNGGRLRFGPDGFLYVSTGDGNNLGTPQDTNSLGGKILRVKDDGTPAPGNPFNNRVWSYGHRNPQGLAWDGTTMFATEHGPSQPSCCDEVNRIEAGKNYGWPDVKGDETKEGTVKNLMNSGTDSNNTFAPSGTTFYNGSIFFAGLRGQALFEVKVNGNTASIVNQLFKNQIGRVRDVVIGPDNALYIATGNKSAQGGSAQPEDDKIYRVTIAGTTTTAPTVPQPTAITPTLFCLGNDSCNSPAPSATTAPGGSNITLVPTGGTNPTGNPTNPSPSVSPCAIDTTSGIATEKHKKKKIKHKHNHGGGFIEQFLKFLLRLIEWLISGGQLPPLNPDPGTQPTVTPAPSGAPCPSPSNAQVPTVQPLPTGAATPTVFNQSSVAPTQPTTPGAIFLGAAIEPNQLDNAAFTNALKKYKFTSLTPENAMKFGPLEPQRGQFNWSGADKIVNYAQANSMRVRGHALVWHVEVPGWVQGLSNAEAEAALKTHIQTVVTRYKGKVKQWDVVNEAFNDDGSLRDTVWKQKVGNDYIAKSFQWAREADPNAELFYNEFGAEGIADRGGNKKAKSDAVYTMVKDFKARGIPIDGVGLQTHSAGDYPGTGAEIGANIKRLTEAGVKVEITELDVINIGDQAGRYAALGAACKQNGCTGVSTWGLYDGHTWLSGKNPLLLDSNFQAKPAYTSLIQALGLNNLSN